MTDKEGAPQNLEIKEGMEGHGYQYLKPAQLSDDEKSRLYSSLKGMVRDGMVELLEGGNKPLELKTHGRSFHSYANRALGDITINGKRFRLIRNKVRVSPSMWKSFVQLWEIETE